MTPRSLWHSYILSARYRQANGKIADLSSRCDVDLMVCVTCFRPINHLSLRSKADTVDVRSEVWKVLDDGTSSLSCSVENSSALCFLISCSQGIFNSTSLSCALLLELLVYMYLSQLMRTFTNYLKCIVLSF